MLFYENLEEIIFQRHNTHLSDELIILSGYIGPHPVERLGGLPFSSSVIYGMYNSDGIRAGLHNSLTALQTKLNNVDIYYSNITVHAKCYAWKRNSKIVHALIGSANFSTNGLSSPNREVLAETTIDTFHPLDDYISNVLNNSILCLDGEVGSGARAPIPETRTTEYCRMTLPDPRTDEVQNYSGLNWRQGPEHHTRPNDSCIPIRASHIRNYPELFPPKLSAPTMPGEGGRSLRHNDKIEIIWDDGRIMEGLLEGSYVINRIKYPKQISSFPNKDTLGKYFRNRIEVPDGEPIWKQDLEQYGRTHIDVSLTGEGVYFFDLSVDT